jgi:hypothetical protein
VLTDTEIRKAKPKDVPFQMADGHGLFLRVTPAGGDDSTFSANRVRERRL